MIMQSVPVDCLSCAHAIWSRLCGAVFITIALLIFKPRCALDFYTELIISYIFLSFFHFEFSPSSGVSCHAAAGGERCLRRRAPRAPRTRTRARQRTAEKVCRKVCVQCECRAVPGPRDASRVVVARRDGSGLERPRVRAASTACDRRRDKTPDESPSQVSGELTNRVRRSVRAREGRTRAVRPRG